MSVFCPKCHKQTYNEYICDYCQYEIKKIQYSKKTNRQLSINRNTTIITLLLLISSISLSYIAYDKYRERNETEKAFKYLTGYDNVDDYLSSDKTKVNSKFTKDTEQIINKSLNNQKNMLNNMFNKK